MIIIKLTLFDIFDNKIYKMMYKYMIKYQTLLHHQHKSNIFQYQGQEMLNHQNQIESHRLHSQDSPC
jgi:hypothetical protein